MRQIRPKIPTIAYSPLTSKLAGEIGPIPFLFPMPSNVSDWLARSLGECLAKPVNRNSAVVQLPCLSKCGYGRPNTEACCFHSVVPGTTQTVLTSRRQIQAGHDRAKDCSTMALGV